MSIFKNVLKIIQDEENAFNEICENDLDNFVNSMLHILDAKYYFYYKIVKMTNDLYEAYMEHRYAAEDKEKRHAVQNSFHSFNDMTGETREKFRKIYGEGTINDFDIDHYRIHEYGKHDLKEVKRLMNLLTSISHESKSDFINRCKRISKLNYHYNNWGQLYESMYNFFDPHEFWVDIDYSTEFMVNSINQVRNFINTIYNIIYSI